MAQRTTGASPTSTLSNQPKTRAEEKSFEATACGWFLAVTLRRLVCREIHCEEMGLLVTDAFATTIDGMTSLFNQSRDVAVVIEGAIAKISGTEQAVAMASRAIEAVVSVGCSYF